MADIGEASGVLGQLGDLGVRIAVDDYGTGYSSLAYLHRLPVNELKLDRSFVANVAADQSNSIIVRSSITMAHSLGFTVVAEGAEDEVTSAILADAGCDAVQGYYFSPPLGRDDLLSGSPPTRGLRFSHEIPSSSAHSGSFPDGRKRHSRRAERAAHKSGAEAPQASPLPATGRPVARFGSHGFRRSRQTVFDTPTGAFVACVVWPLCRRPLTWDD